MQRYDDSIYYYDQELPGGNQGGRRRGEKGTWSKIVPWIIPLLIIIGIGAWVLNTGIDNVMASADSAFTKVSHVLVPSPPQPEIIAIAEKSIETHTKAQEDETSETPTLTPTPQATPTPITITVIGGPLPSISSLYTSTPTPTPMPSPIPTEVPPMPSPIPTVSPDLSATEVPTPTPLPLVTCSFSQTVLLGAGKEVEPCITPTSTPNPRQAILAVTATPSGAPISTPEPININGEIIPVATIMPEGTEPEDDTIGIPQHLLPPAERHKAYKNAMLNLVNKERELAGVPPVVLGSNAAAQVHAEESYENCSMSHWGVDGLKPYMRYAIAGGVQTNGENVAGSNFCVPEDTGLYSAKNVDAQVADIIEIWMESHGHRETMLNKWYTKMNVGLAWGAFNLNLKAIQQFEGDYMEYETKPNIQDNVLTFSGNGKNGVEFNHNGDLGLQIQFDPAPTQLTRGQLARTYCYDGGQLIASIRPNPERGRWYSEESWTTTFKPCPNPFDTPSDIAPPDSQQEARTLWLEAYEESQTTELEMATIPWITTGNWKVRNNTFEVSVNVERLLKEYGDGIYTLAVWSMVGDERFVVSRVPVFYNVDIPLIYME